MMGPAFWWRESAFRWRARRLLTALVALAVVIATACRQSPAASNRAAGPAVAPGTGPAEAVGSTPASPVSNTPSQTPANQGALRSPLPLFGEYAVTANRDDRSLSVIRIGLASVVATVPLEIAPRSVAAQPRSDRAFVAGASAGDRAIAIASLDATSEVASLDLGGDAVQMSAPPADSSGPLIVVSE